MYICIYIYIYVTKFHTILRLNKTDQQNEEEETRVYLNENSEVVSGEDLCVCECVRMCVCFFCVCVSVSVYVSEYIHVN